MNVVFVSSLLLVSPMVFGFSYPSVKFKFLNKLLPSSVYLGETVRIPFEMSFSNLQGRTIWKIPQGTRLEMISGDCPSFPVADGDFWVGACYMNLLVPGTVLGNITSGAVEIEVIGKKKGYNWDYKFGTDGFSIKTLPHCPSFNKTSTQFATANQKFNLNLKNWIKNYDENIKAKSTINLTLSWTFGNRA